MTRYGRVLAAGAVLATLAGPGGAAWWDGTAGAAAAEGAATPDEDITRAPTLASLIAHAYRANPMIEAARQEWKGAVERARVDTAHEDPELMAEGMYMTETLGESAEPDDWTLGISQRIPLPGRLGKAGEVARAETRIGRLKLDAAVRDVAVQVRESYHELLYVAEAKRVAAANRDLLDELRKVGETAYAGNRAALVDVMKAQAQSGQLQYDALLLEELERTEKTRLNALLNRDPDAPIGPLQDEPVRPVAYRLDELYPLAEANLEEVRIAQAGIEKAQAMLAYTRYETLPELKLGLTYGREDQVDQVGLQVGLMLPVWPGKNAGRLGAARADVEKMRAMRTNQINESRALVRDTWFRLQNAERLLRLYRDDLLPQAAAALRRGQAGLSDFVEAQSASYNFQLALARARADYGKFLARLEKLAGRSLTEREAAR